MTKQTEKIQHHYEILCFSWNVKHTQPFEKELEIFEKGVSEALNNGYELIGSAQFIVDNESIFVSQTILKKMDIQ